MTTPLMTTVRSVAEPVVPDVPAEALTTDSLQRWQSSPAYVQETTYFESYPRWSLLPTASRAMIYHCVRSLRPEVVIEIGTYHAGTSEVIARALFENGSGRLLTADPYGPPDRCPSIIANWPEQLRRHVEFFPLNSMAFYLELEGRNNPIDLAFIDGDHAYEPALFDLSMAARLLRPGGTILMDDVDQAGPYFAAVAFLVEHPSWHVIGDNHTVPSALAHPFDSTFNRGSLDNSTALILQAPVAYGVGPTSFSTSQQWIQATALSGVRLNGDLDSGVGRSGVLFWEVIYRLFPPDGSPMEFKRLGRLERVERAHVDCVFDSPITETARGRSSIEVNLLFDSRSQATFSFESIELIRPDGSRKPFFGRVAANR